MNNPMGQRSVAGLAGCQPPATDCRPARGRVVRPGQFSRLGLTAAAFYKRSRTVLTVVNLLLVLAVSRQLHVVLLHQTGDTTWLCTLPSMLLVLLAALGLACVLGLNWLRSSGLALAVQVLLLATGCGLLLKLQSFQSTPDQPHIPAPANQQVLQKSLTATDRAQRIRAALGPDQRGVDSNPNSIDPKTT